MTKTVVGSVRTSSGRTLGYSIELHFGHLKGDILLDGRRRIVDHEVKIDNVSPPPSEAEAAEIRKFAMDQFAVVGEDTFWAQP